MLRNTLQILPGVGPTRERILWEAGIRDWAAYRRAAAEARLPFLVDLAEGHTRLLERAEALLDKGAYAEVARMLPSSEIWRMYGPLRRGAAFLDIETTGLGGHAVVTLVGIYRDGQFHALLKGRELSPGRVRRVLAGASILCTWNGASFDVPFLEARGYELPDLPHWDLRRAFRRLGYEGGLKRTEVALGIERAESVTGITGLDAVRLWREWSKAGDEEALETLVRYNRADVVNLRRIADIGYSRLRAATGLRA